MGAIGEAISGASALSNLASGGKGGNSAGTQQTTLFESPGGITPEQQALADYKYGQDVLQAEQTFAGSEAGGGASLSTMATQMTGGAQMGKALNEADMSDKNMQAEYAAHQASEQASNANSAGQVTAQSNQLSDLNALAKLANTSSSSSSTTG